MSNWLITQLLRAAGIISGVLSRQGRARLGRWIGTTLCRISSSRYAITIDNLARAFPAASTTWLHQTAKASYQNLGITLAELLAFPSLSDADIRSMIRYDGLDLIEDASLHGKGLILLSAHYGNWEMLAFALPLFTKVPVTVIVKPQRNEHADILLNSYRQRTGNTLISMYKAARDMVRILSSGGAVALLADQSATADKDVFVPFFGRPAATFEAPAVLALKFNAPIIMGFAERQADGTYYVDLKKVPHEDLEYNREGIVELTKRHVAMLEEAIRRRPELWVWQHRRWKHTPGEQQ